MEPLKFILGNEPGMQPRYYLLFLWSWTTLACFTFAKSELRKLFTNGPKRYFRDVCALRL